MKKNVCGIVWAIDGGVNMADAIGRSAEEMYEKLLEQQKKIKNNKTTSSKTNKNSKVPANKTNRINSNIGASDTLVWAVPGSNTGNSMLGCEVVTLF